MRPVSPQDVPEPSDALLSALALARTRAEAEQAFEAVFEHFRGQIYAFMLTAVRDRATAEDLSQEVFLRLLRSRQSYRPGSHPRAWVWTIARHLLIDQARKRREVLLAPSQPDEPATDPFESIADEQLSAELKLIEAADRNRLDAAMQRLKPGPREALRLRVVAELSYEEIGSVLGQSVGAIKTWIHRAKLELARALAEDSA